MPLLYCLILFPSLANTASGCSQQRCGCNFVAHTRRRRKTTTTRKLCIEHCRKVKRGRCASEGRRKNESSSGPFASFSFCVFVSLVRSSVKRTLGYLEGLQIFICNVESAEWRKKWTKICEFKFNFRCNNGLLCKFFQLIFISIFELLYQLNTQWCVIFIKSS